MAVTGTGTQEDPFIFDSWKDFVDKLTTDTTQNNDKYAKFSDDVENKVIDFQELYPEGVTLTTFPKIYFKDTDFNNWELRNITTYESGFGTIFSAHMSGQSLRNGIFTNVLLNTPSAAITSGTYTLFGGSYRFTLYDCSINGVFEDYCSIGKGAFKFCSFNISYYGYRPDENSSFECCNMRVDGYKLHGISTYTIGKINNITTVKGAFYPFNNVKFTDCYLEGEMTFEEDNFNANTKQGDIIIPFIGSNQMIHCVIAVNSDFAYIGNGSKTNTYSVYNKDNLPNGLYEPEGFTPDNTNDLVTKSKIFLTGLSTDEMKSVEALNKAGLPVGSENV